MLLDSGSVATDAECCCGGGCECCHDVTVELHITASMMCDSHTLLTGDETRSHTFTQSCFEDLFGTCEGDVDLDCNDATTCSGCTVGQHKCGVLAIDYQKNCTAGLPSIIFSAEMGCSDVCLSDSCDTDTCYETRYFINCSGDTADDFPSGLPEGVTVLNYHCDVTGFCTGSCDATTTVGTMDIEATFTVGSRGPCPPSGGCCIDLDCTIQTPTDCAGMGGVFHGIGTPCFPNPCAFTTGACCNCFGVPGFCIDGVNEADCEDPLGFNGTFAGIGTTCPCP